VHETFEEIKIPPQFRALLKIPDVNIQNFMNVL
jgi:hypothetical protein